MKHAPNGREESQTARDWDPTQEPMNKQPGIGTQEPMNPTRKARECTANSRRTKVEIEMLSVKMRQTKFGDDAEAKKILAETTQLLESVLVQSSKHTL